MSDAKMEMFSFITNCLLTFNYPLAHSMNDEELAEIFKTSNRGFLISWMLKLLDSVYEEGLENSENDKDILSNFVYELGFCTQKEKLPFMTGDLPVSQQVNILSDMFNFIIDIKKYNVENIKDTVTNDKILTLNNANLNLFPMYGDIKLASTEKNTNWAQFEREIEEIQTVVLEEKENDPDGLTEHTFNKDIQQFLDKLKEDLPTIKFILENVCKKKEGTKSTEIIKLQTNSAEILRKCRDNLEIILQFVKDINTVKTFVRHGTELNEEEGSNSEGYFEMVNILYQDVSSVVKHIRSIRC